MASETVQKRHIRFARAYQRDILRLAGRGLSAARIHDRLLATASVTAAKAGSEPVTAGIPSKRTIERFLAENQVERWWSVANADAAEAALVLPVLRAEALRTEAFRTRFTWEEAEWIVKLRTAGVPVEATYFVARQYMDFPERSEQLDMLLAFECWAPEGEAAFGQLLSLRGGAELLAGFPQGGLDFWMEWEQ